jgi:hypothetical protein
MKSTKPFALCLDNTGYEVSLIVGKVYRVLPDKKAAKDDLVRIMEKPEKTTSSTKTILPLLIFQGR